MPGGAFRGDIVCWGTRLRTRSREGLGVLSWRPVSTLKKASYRFTDSRHATGGHAVYEADIDNSEGEDEGFIARGGTVWGGGGQK